METAKRTTFDINGETTDIAMRCQRGENPGFIWLGGFRSDMLGTKAEAMVEKAAAMNCASLRFDYSGHGESSGAFADGTISKWVAQSLAVFEACCQGPQVLVGSSMGGWIALRMVQELIKTGKGDRVAALLLIAPAPDFTSDLMEPAFTDEQRVAIERDGFLQEPSQYSDEPTLITKALIDDGRDNQVLNSPLDVNCPVHILQGMQDPDVPWKHALKLVETLSSDDVVMTLIKDGDHRLSREQDIALLQETMENIVSDLQN